MPPPPIPCPLPPQAHDTGVLDCPDEPVLEVSGCQQMVAGTNVRVWMNVTCPDTKGREVKINLHMDLYEVIGDADGDIDMQVGGRADGMRCHLWQGPAGGLGACRLWGLRAPPVWHTHALAAQPPPPAAHPPPAVY